MTPNPSDRELNEVLARVAGVEIAEFRPGEWYCVANPADIASGSMRWNPLHDANQMERVKKSLGLRTYTITRSRGKSHVQINNDHPQMGSPNVWITGHPDELRAFALTMYAMEQEKQNR